MKNRINCFSLLLLLTIAQVQSQTNPTIQEIINHVSLISLNGFVNELSGEIETTVNGSPCRITSRHSGNVDNDSAALYLKEKLAGYKLDVYEQRFNTNGRNVYAVQPGTLYPKKQYIICAHYDDMPRGSNSPGADDNASGVAAVLEAARILSGRGNHYTIIYALWDKEEQGFYGSDYYAERADHNNDQISGVINLDMIAYDSDNDFEFDLHTKNVANSITLSNTIRNINALYKIGLTIDVINPGLDYSDNCSFWDYGFGAVLFIEDDWDFNDDYHTSHDRIDNFNSLYFLKCSKLAIASLASMAEVAGIVPVELLTLEHKVFPDNIEITWATATELGNYGFDIERSGDQMIWEKIGFVKGNANSTEISYYKFSDTSPIVGKNYYRLVQIDLDGSCEIMGTIEVEVKSPDRLALQQNYPNPFNPSTTIGFELPKAANVTLTLYNILGEKVAHLLNGYVEAGIHEIVFDINDNPVPSGIYFYKLQAGEFTAMRKMIVNR